MEVWKDVPGYEGYYQVSNFGRVKSLERVRRNGNRFGEMILKPSHKSTGYLYVELYKDGKSRQFRVHRLVLSTFCPVDGMEYLEASHLDDNKENCRLDNLRWMTRKENDNWGTRTERMSRTQGNPVYCVELNRTFYGQGEAARTLNIPQANIWKVLKGERKTAGGYHWQYVK